MTSEEQLLADVTLLVEKEQSWMQALIYDTLGFNWKTVLLTAGEHDLYFDQPYAVGQENYDIRTNVMAPQVGQNEDIGCLIKEKHAAYVKVWVSADCVLSYVVFNPKIPS